MANSNVPISAGSGTNIDTRTTAIDGDHRQVVAVGDPSIDAGVAEVVSVPPTESATNYGLVVRLAGSARIHQATAGTFAVYFSPANPIVNIGGTVAIVPITGSGSSLYDETKDAIPIVISKSSTGTYSRVMILESARQIIGTTTERRSIIFVHDSPNTIYIGLSNVLTSAVLGNGFPLVANQIFGFEDYTGPVFGCTEAGQAIVKYIEI